MSRSVRSRLCSSAAVAWAEFPSFPADCHAKWDEGAYTDDKENRDVHVQKAQVDRLLALVLAGVAAFGAHAFTASNTVPDHSAGSGAAAVSGYTISNYAYTFRADGTTINVVAFDLDKAASDVKIALTATPVHADWLDCAGSAGGSNTVTCTLGTPVAASAVNDLHVVAVSTGTATIA